jgi:RNA polymerase-binding transcription factor DksA
MKCGTGSTINPQWRWHYQTLRAERARLLEDRLEQISEASAPIETHVRRPGESAADELAHVVAIGQLDAQQNLLYEIERAIERIETGSYGICERTGRPIPAARLRALPWTRYSRDAEAEFEAMQKHAARSESR